MRKLLRRLLRRGVDDQIREEIDSHIAMRAEHYREAGMAPDDALREARRHFGNTLRIQEETRSQHINHVLETIGQDIRYSLRGLLRNPAFTITAVLVLTLGIGATTAVFSVVDLLLFRSLPYAASERLVSLGMVAPIEQQEFLFGATYAQVRQGLNTVEAFTSWSGISDCDITDKNPMRARCAWKATSFRCWE